MTKKGGGVEFQKVWGKSLELPYGVGIVGKVGNDLGRTQWNPTPSLLDNFISHFPIIF